MNDLELENVYLTNGFETDYKVKELKKNSYNNSNNERRDIKFLMNHQKYE